MSVRDDYFRFQIEEEEKQNDIFSVIIKSLVILLLVIAIIALGIFSYKFLTQDSQKVVKNSTVNQNKAASSNPPLQEKRLKKEEIAMIVQAVLSQMQKQPLKISSSNIKKSEDSELLKSLQNSEVEKIQNTPVHQAKKEKMEEIANKKIKEKVIKKKIVYNAVVIDNKAVKNIDELSKLYAQINRISKKKKKKILKNAYTKKIKKEIIIRENEMRTITVQPGDTLGSIARRAYGKASMYKKIFDANPDILVNPHSLRVGMKLRVPK